MESRKYDIKYTKKEDSSDISAVNLEEEELINNSKYDVQFEDALNFLLNPNEKHRDFLEMSELNSAIDSQQIFFTGLNNNNKREKGKQYKKLRLSPRDIIQDVSEITFSSDSEDESDAVMMKLSLNKKERTSNKLKDKKLERKATKKEKKENMNEKDKTKATQDSVKDKQLPDKDCLKNGECIVDGKVAAGSRRKLNEHETISLPRDDTTKKEKKGRKKERQKK